MLILILFITLTTILFIIFLYLRSSEIVYVKSTIDNQVYAIRRGHSKTQKYLQESADTLAKINQNILTLINHLDTSPEFKSPEYFFIEILKKAYNHTIISEAEIDTRYTTYTVDKQDIHVCLRTRDQFENIYDTNLLMYVLIHELAHFCNYTRSGDPIQGHGPEFRMIFKFLIEQAIKIGVYKYKDYRREPVNYCGINLSSSII